MHNLVKLVLFGLFFYTFSTTPFFLKLFFVFFSQGSLHLLDGVTRKENSKAFRTLTPENGREHNFNEEAYLLLC